MVNEPSPFELNILQDKSFLTAKNDLSQKIISYLADIERALEESVNESGYDFPQGTFLKAGKISKGEQYLKLPYFVLDFPRLFTQKEVFAFRTMLWWGHEFSCTLHLQGEVLNREKSKLLTRLYDQPDLYFCVHPHPWEYHFEPDNYIKLKDLTAQQLENHIDKFGFIKLSRQIPVLNWNEYKLFTTETFARFLHLLK